MAAFTAYTLETASPDAKQILQDVQAGFGFVPNLFAYMAEAPVTIEAYRALMQLIGKSSLTSAQAHTAMLTTSLANGCDFCTIAHRAIAKKFNANAQTIEALLNNTEILDVKDRALVALTQAIVRERGFAPEKILQDFFAAGFTKQQVFEVILTVTIKTLSNYTNHLTQPEINPEFVAML